MFKDVTALDIDQWSDKKEACYLLPVLIRKFVTATGRITNFDFPGHENVQRKGFDGEVEAESATIGIPKGKSVWELSTQKNSLEKFKEDYNYRTKTISKEERENLTFVLLTSRNFPSKNKWVKEKQKEGEWKEVRAYDANDLEQWLELSEPTRVWFSEQMGRNISEFSSLEQEWNNWIVGKSKLYTALFQENVDHYEKKFKQWLESSNFQQPLIITTDSHEEALAFLYCMFERLGSLWASKTMIAKSSQALQKIMVNKTQAITIVSFTKGVNELLSFKQNPVILTETCNNQLPFLDKDKIQSIRLEPPSHEAFTSALQDEGIDILETQRYIRQSAFSLTILRRMLLPIPEQSNTEWAKNSDIIRKLLPITLIGCWDQKRDGDKQIIQKLSNKDEYRLIEEAIKELTKLDSTLLWEEDGKVGVKSLREKIITIKDDITPTDLDTFLDIAKTVLSKPYPLLETIEEIQSPKRKNAYSKYLRRGICDTLILFSIHENEWFKKSNINTKITDIIKGLFTNLDELLWLSHKEYLVNYAEIAPAVFLDILINDLGNDYPTVQVLFKNRKDILIGNINYMHYLLHALEVLAWNSTNLQDVVHVLAQIICVGKKNNYSIDNVFGSLQRIFKCWLPQTSADVNIRKKILYKLKGDFPEIAYKICLDQFRHSDISTYSSRPKWRNDALGKGYKVTEEECSEFQKESLRFLLEWDDHDEQSLSELIEIIPVIDNKNQKKIWEIVSDWNNTNPTDQQKATLRNCIRSFIKTNKIQEAHDIVTDATDIYKLLEPNDIVERYAWLFTNPGLPPELETDNDYDIGKSWQEVNKCREYALKEIWQQKRCEGVLQLLALSDGSNHIGSTLCRVITDSDIKYIFDSILFTITRVSQIKIENFIQGFLQQHKQLNQDFLVIKNIIDHYLAIKAENQVITILKNSPVGKETWKIVYGVPDHLQTKFWLEINKINYSDYSILDLNAKDLEELIDRLISVKRYKFALEVIHAPHLFKKVNSKQLSSLLQLVVLHEEQHQEPTQHKLRDYTIAEIFKELSERQDASQKELAQLEFYWIDLLQYTNHRIPNLNREVIDSPESFVQILQLFYEARENNHWQTNAYTTLQQIYFSKENDQLIGDWVTIVRKLYIKSNLEQQGDYWVGYILSHGNKDHNNVWDPSETIKKVLETIKSKTMAEGIVHGIINSRGAVYGTKGKAEREISKKYHELSELLNYDYPFMSKIMGQLSNSYLSEAENFWEPQEKLERYVSA